MSLKQRIYSFRNELILIITAVVYTAVFSYYSFQRYMMFQAGSFDLGIKIQSIYTSIYGVPLDTPDWVNTFGTIPNNYFAIHFSPIVYPFGVLLHIFPAVQTLFILQWGFIALAGVLLYAIIRENGTNRFVSYIVFLIFLLYPPTIMSGMYDVHFLSMFPFAIFLLYYGLKKENIRISIIAFIFGFLLQEAFMIVVPFIVLQALFSNCELRNFFASWKINKTLVISLVLTVTSIVILGFELEYIHSFSVIGKNLLFSSRGYGFSPLNLFVNFPLKIEYFTVLLSILLFIPVIGWKRLTISVPGIMLILFTSRTTYPQFAFQYSFIVTPGLFLAFAEGILILNSKLKKTERTVSGKTPSYQQKGCFVQTNREKNVVALTVTALVFALLLSPVLPLSHELPNSRSIYSTSTINNGGGFNLLTSSIELNKSILASDNLFPHIATHKFAYPILYKSNGLNGTVYGKYPSNFQPSYILIFPGDYNRAQHIVKGFPSLYGLEYIASVNDTVGYIGGKSVKVHHYILLYVLGYSRETKYVAGYNTIFISPSEMQVETGKLTNTSSVSQSGSQIIENYSSAIPFLMFHGPSTANYSFELMPGTYKITFFINASQSGLTLSTLIFQVTLYAEQINSSISVINITTDNLKLGVLSSVNATFILNRPVSYFSFAAIALKHGYSFEYYGSQIHRI